MFSSFFDFFRKIYEYREYLKQSVLRDLRTKYKRSLLGYLWTMLHPLGMMVILATVFSHVMRIPTKDYAIFLFPAMLSWNYFASSSLMSLGNIRANARLFSQVPVPKYIFIVSLCCSNLVNLLLAIFPLLAIMLVLGRPITPVVLALPIVILPLIFVTLASSLILATSNVFFDDTLHLSEVALQALYFLTPILYGRTLLPAHLIKFLELNPLFCQVEFIRGLFYDAALPNLQTFAINTGGSLLLLAFAIWIFSRSERKFLYFI